MNAFLMHWGILAIMKIRFRYQLSGAAFAPFLALERGPERVRRLLTGPPRPRGLWAARGGLVGCLTRP